MIKRIKTEDGKEGVRQLLKQLGGMQEYISPNDNVLIKPSFNSADDFPATTSLAVLEETIKQVKKITNNVVVGESSGVLYKPASKVFSQLGVDKLCRKLNVELINFDKHDWVVKKNEKAKYLKEVEITSVIDNYDKIIFLPTLRTHRGAGFTLSLKIGMGFLRTSFRTTKMHSCKLKEKIADMNLYFKPDLIILDARKAFITDGPERGKLVCPGEMLASTNRLELDKAGLKLLKENGANISLNNEVITSAESLDIA
ncbi:MAG: DUF362 domain-containing protein [Candidatus Nanoarchaeia archaeon]